ncbi:MAG: (deoxy)nucleoside triphosphate pyrophosphohydrolase [Peptococcaceae bacterium]|nr:(deoxy)nucleoside triphosphate pyrophosphohydrolase [Peptococcaceae bacterium]
MKQVAAAIFLEGNKVFIAKRSIYDSLPGKWEFPGGKLEQDETPEQCLHREMIEEFGVPIRIERYYAKSIFEHKGQTMELLGYLASMLQDDICLNVHDEGKWVEIKDLPFYDFASADIPFVQKLLTEGI